MTPLAALDANAETSARALDRIARTACRVLDVPVALVNLVDADRQRFVGRGTDEEPWASTREVSLDKGFCPFVVRSGEPLAFADAVADPELAANPVVGEFGVRAYAGVPLRGSGGEPIGTLCAVDYEPHNWCDSELALLSDLAASAVSELQLLSATRQAVRQRERLHALEAFGTALAAPAADVAGELQRAAARAGACAVWLLALDESGGTLRTAGAAGGDAEALERQGDLALAAHPVLAQALEAGGPELVATRAELGASLSPALDLVPAAGSAALLPLSAGERRLGLAVVCFAGEHEPAGEDRDYLAALAATSGLALACLGG